MSLGWAYVSLPLCHGQRPCNLDAATRQIDITPSERHQLAPPSSGKRGQCHRSAEDWIPVLSSLDQSGHPSWRRNLPIHALHPWRRRPGSWSVVDPPPLHRLPTGSQSMQWYLWTVAGESPSANHVRYALSITFGLKLFKVKMSQDRPDSTFDLPSILVERTRTLVPLPTSSHLSSNWPTVAVVRLNLPASTSATERCESLGGGPLPSLERLRHLAWLSGSGVASGIGAQLPVSRRSFPHGAGLNSPIPPVGIAHEGTSLPKAASMRGASPTIVHVGTSYGSRPSPGVFAHRPGFKVELLQSI